jgi:hypothetical protein
VPFASHSTGLFVAWHHWSAQDLHAHTPLTDAQLVARRLPAF